MISRKSVILPESTLYIRMNLLRCLQKWEALLGGSMKCPRCGFVSYADLAHCKKCGFEVKQLLESPQQNWLEVGKLTVPEENSGGVGDDWKVELTNRLQDYRKKRTKVPRDADIPATLELDFASNGSADERVLIDEAASSLHERPLDLNLDLEIPPLPRGDRTVPLKTSEAIGQEPSSAAAISESKTEFPAASESRPMEFIFGSPEAAIYAEERETVLLAPLGRRFLAGLADAIVLVLSAGLFGIIFWYSGGHLSPNPLNFTVFAVIGVSLVFAYFALFAALISTTPGLLWLGCEIRNWQGDPPTAQESCWRAFGVLVSLSGLLLGFIWALVDSESMTWHDRMSGTFIAQAGTQPAGPRLEAHL